MIAKLCIDSVVTPASNIGKNELWSQISPFEEKNQQRFEKLHESNLRLQELLALQNATIQTLQEGYDKLSKASVETKRRPKQVLEEQYHCSGDRDYLDKETNKLFDVCQNMKPQSQSHAFGNDPHLQEDIKTDNPMESKHKSSSQSQDGDNMTY
ncbi:hypothetical protein O181_084631 [Austropuccinia psidii MF-1]|uniref:Uncharacterized protein n=1 Tax=Austropuccinia psidii MF-1 TaxID=1389203 RepID=A0A9Q3IIZ6_9BASI|nr:hypothetical protein [Austropuccinia psidii MF-1]